VPWQDCAEYKTPALGFGSSPLLKARPGMEESPKNAIKHKIKIFENNHILIRIKPFRNLPCS
jgi:hypothetical protein